MELYRVCYRCTIRWENVRAPLGIEIEKTLRLMRRGNRQAGVTGALLLGDQHIVQMLEGQPGPVLDMVYCALQDPRLALMEGIIHEPAEERMFPNSLMFFRDLTDGVAASAFPALRNVLDDPRGLTREAALEAFGQFSSDMQEGRLTNNMLMI